MRESLLRTVPWVAAGLCLGLPAATVGAPSDKPAWQPQAVPNVWRKPPGGNGFGWYRCLVHIPEAWKGKPLQLFLEPVDDAREAYLNGVRIGGSGTYPPAYRSGLGGESRFNVPESAVRFGSDNYFAVRVFFQDGRTDFNVAAPVLFGGDQAIRLGGNWQFRSGDDAAWAKADGEKLTDCRFSKLEPTAEIERTLRKLDGETGPLSPADALKQMKVADDLVADVVLADPVIGQPLAISFDERGRMWLIQYLQYPNPAGLTMVSRDKHLRTVYDKVPPAPPNHVRGLDKISIHEDTDGDGVYDKHSTFVEGLNLATSAARGRGGVFVLNPPYLLFYPDANNDDAPDGDPQVLLQGFGIEDSHSVVSNLHWGPDGWLYASQGSTVTGNVIRPGLDKTPVHSMGQLIWRYHPETRRYEIFAEGGGNAFGVEIDSKGRVYSGHNGPDTRGFHYVQGGYYRKGFGKHGALSNPYTFGFFENMKHPSVLRFTHTFVIYEGGALPKHYDGNLFGVAPLLSHVVHAEVTPNGASYQTRDLGHPLSSPDTWFRPVEIKVGPDGGVYVADFYEQRIDHAAHYQGRVDKSTGRIYRLRAPTAKPIAAFDLGKRTTHQLIETLRHENKWFRQTALRLIADRKDAAVIPALRREIERSTGQYALECLWALYLSGGLDNMIALRTMDHSDPFVRLWTVRLLCDEKKVDSAIAAKIAQLAYQESDLQARSQLACSARRLPADQSLPIVRNLARHAEDSKDIFQPLLLWWALEAKADDGRDALLQLLSDTTLWDEVIVREHILDRVMRRFAQSGRRKDLLICATLFGMSPSQDHSKRLLKGFEAAYEGRPLVGMPNELLTQLAKVGGVSLALRLRQKEPQAVQEALKIITDEKAAARDRIQYIEIFGQVSEAACLPTLFAVIEKAKDAAVRNAALTSLQTYADAPVPATVIPLHNHLPQEVREVAQSVLASRKPWATELLSAIDSGAIDKKLVGEPALRKILLYPEPSFAAAVTKHFGEIKGATTEEMRRQVEKYAAIIGTGSGNPYEGRTSFSKTCGKCHTLFDDGGKIGPNLTNYKRDDLKGMLVHVVNPSAEIREGFENYVVATADGRTLNGFVEDQDNQVVVLKGADGQKTVIERKEVEVMRAVPQSLMPEGILNPFTDQQVRDLFAYLRASQPLP